MKINAYLIIALLLISKINGSSQNIYHLNLDEAVEMALNNSIELKNMKVDEASQYYQNKEVFGMALPQVTASGNLTYYTNLPVFILPFSDISVYQVLAKEGVKDRNGNPIDITSATASNQRISLVAPLNYQLGLDVQQLLFQPEVFVALQARQTLLDYAKQNTSVAEEKVKEDIQKAYYGVLVAHKQREVLQTTLTRLNNLNSEMIQMHQGGFIEKLDLDKLEVTINNTNTLYNQLNNTINITEALLKNTLVIPQSDSIVLTETLEVQDLRTEVLQAEENFNYNNRKEIALVELGKKLQEIDLKRYKLNYLPTIAAFYQLQATGMRNKDYDIDGSGSLVSYTTGMIGLSITQPIFDGFQRKNKVQQARLSVEKMGNTMEQLKQGIDLERTVAKNSLNNALQNLEIQKRNETLAQSVFEVSKKKYQSGVGSSIELLQADTEYQRAVGSYFQAFYDVIIAKIEYLKSLGKL